MQLGERWPRLRRRLDWRSGSLKGEERERLNIVRPSVRVSRGSLGHYSRHGATGAHFGSAFVHSHTLDSGRTNEQWPLYTEPKNLFSLCRRFRMWLHRMRDQTTLFEGTEPRRGGARVRVAYQIISLLRYPSGTKIWTKSFMFV